MKREIKEGKEAKEVKEAKATSGDASRVAAFFDLDGTLVALPSMEQRFFCILRYRGEISPKNYFLWLREAVRLAPRGIQEMLQTNKTYLRGVQKISDRGGVDSEIFPRRESGLRRDPRLPVPAFFAEGVECVAWHAREGHAVVLVSGTLEPLAKEAAKNLEIELAARGIALKIRVCATQLEEKDGRWTGNVLGEAMRGQAKARAARRMAAEQRWDLPECFAYGDSASDAWLLAAVGRPAAVNPSSALRRIARTQGWPMLRWSESQKAAQNSQRSRSSLRRSSLYRKANPRELESEERDEPEERQLLDAAAMRAEDRGARDEQR